jgi:TrmH family RNA methyltransferase
MLSNRLLKYYSSLLHKKFRKSENKFIVEGKKLVYEGLKSNYECEIVIITEEFYRNNKEFIEFVKQRSIIEKIEPDEVKRLSDTETPQGVFAIFNKREDTRLNSIDRLIIALDNINDPGNVGTILRSCDWFGVKSVFLSEGCAEVFNPKTIRASMGSLFRINFIDDVNLINIIAKYKNNGYLSYATDLNGENIYSFNFPHKGIIIFSNEANGPNQDLLNNVDGVINIPKFGNAESLNVSTASAVILSEYARRNLHE